MQSCIGKLLYKPAPFTILCNSEKLILLEVDGLVPDKPGAIKLDERRPPLHFHRGIPRNLHVQSWQSGHIVSKVLAYVMVHNRWGRSCTAKGWCCSMRGATYPQLLSIALDGEALQLGLGFRCGGHGVVRQLGVDLPLKHQLCNQTIQAIAIPSGVTRLRLVLWGQSGGRDT